MSDLLVWVHLFHSASVFPSSHGTRGVDSGLADRRVNCCPTSALPQLRQTSLMNTEYEVLLGREPQTDIQGSSLHRLALVVKLFASCGEQTLMNQLTCLQEDQGPGRLTHSRRG